MNLVPLKITNTRQALLLLEQRTEYPLKSNRKPQIQFIQLETELSNLSTPNQAEDLDCRAGCLLCPSNAGNFCLCQILSIPHDYDQASSQTSHKTNQKEEEVESIEQLITKLWDF